MLTCRGAATAGTAWRRRRSLQHPKLQLPVNCLPACRDSKGTRRAHSMLDSVSRLDAAGADGVSHGRLKRVSTRSAA